MFLEPCLVSTLDNRTVVYPDTLEVHGGLTFVNIITLQRAVPRSKISGLARHVELGLFYAPSFGFKSAKKHLSLLL